MQDIKQQLREILNNVEFLHRVPVKAPEETIVKIEKLFYLAVEQEKERVLKQVEKGVHDVIWNEDGGLKSHDVSYIVSSVMHYLMDIINNK